MKLSSNIPMGGSTMEKVTATAPTPEFKIPAELLKMFQGDVRLLPVHLPVAGYIMFDAAMLKSILLGDDQGARANLARQLDALSQAGGELVIIAR
jgi:hypothetical protein